MIVLRFFLPLLAALTLLAVVATPLAEQYVANWGRRDVELRAEMIAESLRDTLVTLWQGEQGAALTPYRRLFDTIARDERVMAAGLCKPDGKLIVKSAAWPEIIPCPPPPPSVSVTFRRDQVGDKQILVGNFPIVMRDERIFTFVILHDLNFSLQRAQDTRIFFLIFLILVSVTAAAVTLLTMRFTLRGWLTRLRQTLNDPQTSFASQNLPREFLPVVREVRQQLRALRHGGFDLESIKVDWTPQALKKLLEQDLPDTEMLVVSNREPYIHNHKNGKVVMQHPASGVVTALEPIMRACGGVWIAHGSGTADKEVVDANDCLPVPPDEPDYLLRRVWLTKEEEEGYYYGFANEGMWPLCHISFVRPNFRADDWEHYKNVNRKFADAVVQQAKTPNPVILVQDYHFALLPRYIRERLPDATILTFWHIPWPNPEIFSICPWREEILAGLLGSSVIGFHTQFHCQNFMETVDRFLESHIHRDESLITSGAHNTLVRPYPISIAWPPAGLEDVPPAAECRAAVMERYKLKADAVIGVGVERFDYTKGIIDRFQAVGEFLRHYPDWRGRFTFIQAAAPTRSQLPAYQAIHDETLRVAAAINAEFGTADYQPIILLAEHHEADAVFTLFRASDLCIVSSLHDGMNLVAKEFVAARDDEQGVLILSTFAGASKELLEALPVNPYDARGMAAAIHRALTMPADEQKERMRLLRAMVKENNVYYWAARIMLDAGQLRRRAHIERFVARNTQDANE